MLIRSVRELTERILNSFTEGDVASEHSRSSGQHSDNQLYHFSITWHKTHKLEVLFFGWEKGWTINLRLLTFGNVGKKSEFCASICGTLKFLLMADTALLSTDFRFCKIDERMLFSDFQAIYSAELELIQCWSKLISLNQHWSSLKFEPGCTVDWKWTKYLNSKPIPRPNSVRTNSFKWTR